MRTSTRSLLAPMFAGLLLMTASPAAADNAGGADEPELERPVSACDPSWHDSYDRQFADVRPGATHAANIRCAAVWGIAWGRTRTMFAPQEDMTRGQMASFVHRLGERVGARGALPDVLSLPFADVDLSNGHSFAIGVLYDNGVVNGMTPDTYEPDREVSRAQMAAFINRLHHTLYDEPITRDIATFPDVPVGSTHGADIGRLAAAGIALGDADGAYRPADPVSREQMASFMARYLEVLHGQDRIPHERYPQNADPDRPVP